MNKEEIINHQTLINVYKDKMNKRLSMCTKKSLVNLELIYLNRKLNTVKNAFPVGYKEKDEEIRKIEVEKLEKVIKDRIKKYYGEEKVNIDIIERDEKEDANSAYNVLETFKKGIKEIAIKTNTKAKTLLSEPNIERIHGARNRENQYYNEIVNGIYATTEYNGINLYAIRAASNPHGMIIKGNNAYFPSNPFIVKDNMILLKRPVFAYSMDIREFEPVVDFTYINEEAKIHFGYEWIAKVDSLDAEQEVIDEIPIDLFDDYNVYVYEDDKQVLINSKIEKNFVDKHD